MGNNYNKQLVTRFEHEEPLTQMNNDHCLPVAQIEELGKLQQPVEERLIQQSVQVINSESGDGRMLREQLIKCSYKDLGDGKFYQGHTNEMDEPQGLGQIVYQDGSVLVAEFSLGDINKTGMFVFNDGSCYKGEIVDKQANGKGELIKDKLSYSGYFRDNLFHGEGNLTIGDRYEFKGSFENNKKKQGYLSWFEEEEDSKFYKCTYEGKFDENQQFTGEAVLINKYGTYKGLFQEGMKQGKGVFEYRNGSKYVGNYVNGIRHGYGTLYSANKSQSIADSQIESLIAYQGQFFQGMPHGKGSVYEEKTGKLVESEWDRGVHKSKVSI